MNVILKRNVKTIDDLQKYINNITKSNVKRLYHYTSFESLVMILKYKCIRLSRMDLMNDKAEEALSQCNIDERRYNLSFSNSNKEYVSMWAMYGKASGIKLRIDFPTDLFKASIKDNFFFDYNKNDKIPISQITPDLITKKDFLINDVVYYDKENEKIRHNANPFDDFEVNNNVIEALAGFVKYDAWEFEKETRLSVLLDHFNGNDNIKYIYAGINDELIREMSITYNPWISEPLRTELQKSIDSLAGFPLTHGKSENDGEIGEL